MQLKFSKKNFFNDILGSKLFHSNIIKVKEGQNSSVFTDRTDESSASQYFQFYGYLSQQQNMLQDFIRTSTYQKAILGNYKDFQVHSRKSIKSHKIKLLVKLLFQANKITFFRIK